MRTLVRKSVTSPPLIDTNEATSIEVRDDDGRLVYVLLLMPGRTINGHQAFVTCDCSDPDFDDFIRNFGLARVLPPNR